MVMHVTETINDMPAKERRKLNRSSSAPTIKIRLNQSSHYESYFSFKYFHKSFALNIVTVVMFPQSQRTNEMEVDSQRNAWDFPEELPVLGNSIDPLGSRYLQRIPQPPDGDSASALHSKDMLAALQNHACGFWVLIWKTHLAFLFLKDAFFLLISLCIRYGT